LEKHIQSGIVTVQQVDPAELSPGEFAVRILRCVEAGAKLVVIDSLNGYLNAMPGEKYLNNQLHELSSYLNQKGVITILALAQHGLVAAAESPVDLSYLTDTVLSLRYFEAAGEVKQAGVAQLSEDLGAGYFMPVDQDCVVEERRYFGALLISAGQSGQGGAGCV